jgi:hypothetical protein
MSITGNVSLNSTGVVGFFSSTTTADISYLQLQNSLRTWQSRNHANGTFAIRDQTATLDRIQVDFSGNVAVVSNNLTLGTPTRAATGFTFLTNGLKINWGFSAANTTTGNVTFTSAFTTACYGVMTSGANLAGQTSYVVGVNTTVAQVRSSSTANPGGNVYYIAYGV